MSIRLGAGGALLLLAASATPVHADWLDRSYVGAGYGVAGSSWEAAELTRALQARGHAVTASIDGESPGGTVFVGYQLSEAAAVELGLVYAGEFETRIDGAPISAAQLADDIAELTGGAGPGISLGLRFNFPLVGSLVFSPQIGLYTWRTTVETRVAGVTSEVTKDGVGKQIGLGLGMDLPAGFYVGLSHERLIPKAKHSIGLTMLKVQYQLENPGP